MDFLLGEGVEKVAFDEGEVWEGDDGRVEREEVDCDDARLGSPS